MTLLMENKGKVMEDYLFNYIQFTVSKTGLKMLCHVVLISTVHCITEMISNHLCLEIQVMMFLGSIQLCLFISYVNQTAKSNLSPIYYQKNMH